MSNQDSFVATMQENSSIQTKLENERYIRDARKKAIDIALAQINRVGGDLTKHADEAYNWLIAVLPEQKLS